MGGGGGSVGRDDYQRLAEAAKEKLRFEASDSPHVFISFDHEDKAEVNLLRGQAKNEKSELAFDDYSVKEPFNSKNADYLKQKIREKIERCSVTVVYLTEKTSSSEWVNWEISESLRLGKGVVGVYKDGERPSSVPRSLDAASCEVVPWKQSVLQSAIERASAKRK